MIVGNLMRRLTSALNAMLSRIMQVSITDELIADTDRHIKQYLSLLTELDNKNIEHEKSKRKESTIKQKKGGRNSKESTKKENKFDK